MKSDTLSDLFSVIPADLQRLSLPQAELRFQQRFYAAEFCQSTLPALRDQTLWRHEQIVLFGKSHWQPRLVAAYGDADTTYTYSGLTLPMHPWTPLLQQIRRDIEAVANRPFNSVLLNFYRDQNDSMGWHSDDESELGPDPVIASLSFGTTRTFKLKHKIRRDLKTISMNMTDGSLLLMEGTTQQYWKHAVDKTRDEKGPRINLTFRQIIQPTEIRKRQRTERPVKLML